MVGAEQNRWAIAELIDDLDTPRLAKASRHGDTFCDDFVGDFFLKGKIEVMRFDSGEIKDLVYQF